MNKKKKIFSNFLLKYIKPQYERNYLDENLKKNYCNLLYLLNISILMIILEFFLTKKWKHLLGILIIQIIKIIPSKKLAIIKLQIIILYFYISFCSIFKEEFQLIILYLNLTALFVYDFFSFSWSSFSIFNFFNNFVLKKTFFKYDLICFMSNILIFPLFSYFLEYKKKKEWFKNNIENCNENSFFKEIFNTFPNGIILIDGKKKIIFSNEKFKTLNISIDNLKNLENFQNGIKEANTNVESIQFLNFNNEISSKNKKSQNFKVSYNKIIFKKSPCFLLSFYINDDNDNIKKKMKSFNYLIEQCDKILYNMEKDFNHWSNLQSLKVKKFLHLLNILIKIYIKK